MADSGSGITTSGGAGGIGASLDDMRTESKALEALTSLLAERARSAASAAVDPDLLESAILSPSTAVAAEEKIVFATGQLLLFATEAGVTAVFLEGAVIAYETADKALAALIDVATNATTFAIGVAAIPVAIGAGVLALGDVAATYVIGYGEEAVDAVQQGFDKTMQNPWVLLNPGAAAGIFLANSANSFSVDDAEANKNALLAAQLKALGDLVQAHLGELDVLAGQNAGLVSFLAQGMPGLLTGLTVSVDLLLTPLFGADTPAEVNAAMTALTGVPWPPTSYDQALQAIIGAGNRGGMFDDGRPLTQDDLFTPPLILGAGIGPHGGQVLAPPVDAHPYGVSDLFAGSAEIDAQDSLGGDPDAFARIRIITVAGPPPRYIVQIPSTQSWDPTAGSTPNDLTSDTRAMLDKQTALSSAVVAAMKAAHISSTDPVMLEGFSLGGITAGQMAADPNLGFNVTHVVTCGAPIANFDIPPKTQVLSYEYDEDPVAKLDGNDNPGNANWTTVHANAPQIAADQGTPVGISGAHNATRYEQTAAEADRAGNASIDAWNDSASDYFTGKSSVVDYGATR